MYCTWAMGTVRNVNYLPIFTFTTFCTVLMLIVTTKIELMLIFLQVHYVNVCFLSAHLVRHKVILNVGMYLKL